MSTSPRPFLVLLFVGTAAAQNFVQVPTSFSGVPAPETTIYPVGFTDPSRVQNLYAPAAVGLGAPVVLNRMDIRAEEFLTQAGKTLTLSVVMARGVLPGSATRNYASNYSSVGTTVFTSAVVNVVASPSQSPGPHPVMLPFSTLYPYFPSATDSLLVDITSPGTSLGGHFHDAPWAGVTSTSLTSQAVVAPGCMGTATVTNFSSPGTVTWNWTGVSTTYTAAFLFLGTTPAVTPLTVSPLTVACPLNVEIVCAPFLSPPGTPAGAGAWTYALPVPSGLARPDTRIVTQWVSWPPSPTVVTSTTHELVFTGTDPVCRVYSCCTASSPVGTRQFGTCNVIRLYL